MTGQAKINDVARFLPILVYHHCPSDFEFQLNYLKELGYNLVHLNDVVEYLIEPKKMKFPEKRIVLTFDDAYMDFKQAAHLLENNGFKGKATICVPTGYVSEDVNIRKFWNQSPIMNWNELKQLKDDGFEIISHSVSHANLDDIKDDKEQLRYEIGCSKRALKFHPKLKIENLQFFCFPFGAGWKEKGNSDQRINNVLRDEGYIGALRAEYKVGEPWDQFCIPRCEPSTITQLQQLMEGEFSCK